MARIHLIRNPDDCEGTCHFELLPGRYETGECWMPGSLFLSEEDFNLIEPCIQAAIPGFDHFAFTVPARQDWDRALANLDRLQTALETCVDEETLQSVLFLDEVAKSRILGDWPRARDELSGVIRELIAWVREKLREHDTVSILGL